MIEDTLRSCHTTAPVRTGAGGIKVIRPAAASESRFYQPSDRGGLTEQDEQLLNEIWDQIGKSSSPAQRGGNDACFVDEESSDTAASISSGINSEKTNGG
jgi:hypothetical protein